jgi:hypothetical protein
MTIEPFLDKVTQFILNPIIILIFAIAFVIFFWGIFQFIATETVDSQREQGKRKIFYGLLGMFIMFSAYGLIRFIINTFGLGSPSYPTF